VDYTTFLSPYLIMTNHLFVTQTSICCKACKRECWITPPLCHRTTFMSPYFVDYTTFMLLMTTFTSLKTTYMTRLPPFCLNYHLYDASTTYMSLMEFIKLSVRLVNKGSQRFLSFAKNKVNKQVLKTRFNKQL